MNILAYDRTSCILCGARLESNARKWCAKEIRVLYTSSVDCTQATLSGVGIIRHGSIVQVPIDPNVVDMSRQPRGLDEREGFIKARLHSLKRHQHTQTLRQHGTLFVRPLVPFLWGFAIHSFCWDMLNAESAPDLQVLFQACLSMPLSRSGALDWGHDYIGLIDPVPIEDPRGSKLGAKDLMGDWWRHSTPSQIPEIQELVEAEHIAPSTAQPMPEKGQEIPIAGDRFLSLPTELREMVLFNLPSKDVYALKLASPVFANMQLPDGFWASRFEFDHEFGYVLEARSSRPQFWRSLYFAMDRLKENPAISLSGRFRVWELSSMLKHQLREAVHPACHGEPVIGLIEPQHSSEWLKTQWQTATRGLVNEPDFFEFGCRPLRTRVVQVPTPLRLDRVVVSFARVGTEKYISGLELLIHNDSSIKIGCAGRGEKQIEVDKNLLPICGWHLALGMSGIQGIAAVMKDGSLSSWVGKYEDLPRYSLRGGGGDLLAMKAEFDAFRMVSLSIHTSNMETTTWINHLPWKYLCPWMPEIPPDHYILDGSGQEYAHWYMGMEGGTDVGKSRPIDAFYFGGSHGELLPLLKEIIVYSLAGTTIQITGVEFTYTDSSRDRFFGMITSDPDAEDEIEENPEEAKFSVPIDGPGGERIKGIDVLYTKLFDTRPMLKGLKIRTNRRTAEVLPAPVLNKRKIASNILDSSEYPSQVLDQQRTVDVSKNWITLEPRGQELVGIYAVLGWNMIENFGLISMNRS
uniref:F-box domain-containing protein n=1 Tax=Bionectria ochroleuca TaxID=29856 RepID=A0A0B7KJX4_BIOOC